MFLRNVIGLHGVLSQEVELSVATAVRISDPTCCSFSISGPGVAEGKKKFGRIASEFIHLFFLT
jgi:hypothetical protein